MPMKTTWECIFDLGSLCLFIFFVSLAIGFLCAISQELIKYGQRLRYQEEQKRDYEEAWRAVSEINIDQLKQELQEHNKEQARRFDGEGKLK
jgi:Tfp pilus assembly protein PilO